MVVKIAGFKQDWVGGSVRWEFLKIGIISYGSGGTLTLVVQKERQSLSILIIV